MALTNKAATSGRTGHWEIATATECNRPWYYIFVVKTRRVHHMALDEGSFRLASSRERARLDVWRLGRTGPRKAACGDRGLELRVPEGPPGNTFKTPCSTTQAMVWGRGGGVNSTRPTPLLEIVASEKLRSKQLTTTVIIATSKVTPARFPFCTRIRYLDQRYNKNYYQVGRIAYKYHRQKSRVLRQAEVGRT